MTEQCMAEHHRLTAKLSQLLEDKKDGKDVPDSEINELASKAAKTMLEDNSIQDDILKTATKFSEHEGWDFEQTKKLVEEIYIEQGVAELKRILDPETSTFELKPRFRNMVL